jgi:ribonuclease III
MSPKRPTGAALAAALEEKTGHAFRDPDRLQRALTHASVRGQTGAEYERLEFLGDRVLGLIIAEHLFASWPDAAEGELSRRLNSLVNAETCADVAEEIGLHELIHAGSEIRTLTGRKRINIRADAMESLIATIYLEGGLGAVRPFVLRYWEPRSKAVTASRRDAKTALQEWAHQVSGEAPLYKIENREGPDHDPIFRVSVTVPGYASAEAEGRSRREAEQNAATTVLLREGVWADGEQAA